MAMILTLSGTTIAALTTFKAEELIARGEIFQIQNTVNQSFLSHGTRTLYVLMIFGLNTEKNKILNNFIQIFCLRQTGYRN